MKNNTDEIAMWLELLGVVVGAFVGACVVGAFDDVGIALFDGDKLEATGEFDADLLIEVDIEGEFGIGEADIDFFIAEPDAEDGVATESDSVIVIDNDGVTVTVHVTVEIITTSIAKITFIFLK